MTPGAELGVYVGPVLPTPLAPEFLELVEQATVTTQDGGRSGFQLTLVAARDQATGTRGFPPLTDQVFKIGNRLQLTGTIGATTHVVMDGIVSNLQLAPGDEPNASRLTVTGEDLAVMLDLVEVSLPFPGMPDSVIAQLLLAGLATFGVVPVVIPAPTLDMPLPTEKVPHRTGTFLGIIEQMAQQWGYTFYIDPGPTRGTSTAYWGPPIRAGVPQKALTWRMGAASNLGSVQFQADGTKPTFVGGLIHEKESSIPVPIIGLPFTGQPLAAVPSWVGNLPLVRFKRLSGDEGGDAVAALWRATGEVFRSMKAAVTASGEVDVAGYGDVLKARRLVDVRGVGHTMDGSWYVSSVTHTISRGSWTQSFNLEREGTGALGERVART